MKRSQKFLILFLVSLVVAAACAKAPETLPPGKYVLDGAPSPEWAWVLIEKDSQFEFNRNLATSYRPQGSYTVKDGIVTLQAAASETYVFELKEGKLIFQEGEMAAGFLKKGDVFALSPAP